MKTTQLYNIEYNEEFGGEDEDFKLSFENQTKDIYNEEIKKLKRRKYKPY